MGTWELAGRVAFQWAVLRLSVRFTMEVTVKVTSQGDSCEMLSCVTVMVRLSLSFSTSVRIREVQLTRVESFMRGAAWPSMVPLRKALARSERLSFCYFPFLTLS